MKAADFKHRICYLPTLTNSKLSNLYQWDSRDYADFKYLANPPTAT